MRGLKRLSGVADTMIEARLRMWTIQEIGGQLMVNYSSVVTMMEHTQHTVAQILSMMEHMQDTVAQILMHMQTGMVDQATVDELMASLSQMQQQLAATRTHPPQPET